jgi:hypothetical protein
VEYKKIQNNYIIRIDKGEEIVTKIKELCEKENINLGFISGIGATDNLEIGLFNTKTKQYYPSTLNGLYEITSIMGNVTTKDGEIYLHLHINVSDEDNNTYGGHLNKCYVSATAEIIINVVDGNINRKFDEEIGLNLLEFQDENR